METDRAETIQLPHDTISIILLQHDTITFSTIQYIFTLCDLTILMDFHGIVSSSVINLNPKYFQTCD